MHTPTRQEKDSIGFVDVPEHALYGAQTARAVRNFPISGMHASPYLIRAMGMVKFAAAQANGELGCISHDQQHAIVQAAREVINGLHDPDFVVDAFQAGAGVSFHMNANEVLANRASQILQGALGEYTLVHPNDHVNFGQSTNDVFPAAMRLATLLALEDLFPVLRSLADGFELKGREFDHILKSGRTHMQDAVPMRLGQEFAAYGVAFERATQGLRANAEPLRELGLGGSAVGTGLNTHPQYRTRAIDHLSRISGQSLTPAADMRFAMQSCAPMAAVSGALRTIALELIRISNDLRLLASGPNTGLHEIELPALQPGSSIMPGKVNPVLPELAAMVGFQVIGNDTAVALAVQAGQLELNVMMPVMAHNILQSITILTNTLREFDHRCVRGITANQQRCVAYAESTVSLATALNPLVGYARAAEVVKKSVATGRTIVEIVREEKLLPEEKIAEVLDVRAMTSPHGHAAHLQ